MHVRWPLALALLWILGPQVNLTAQARVTVGSNVGRGAHPGPRAQRPIHGPLPTIGIVPPFRGGRGHLPVLLRSPFLGLVAFDPYWWLVPDAGDEIVALPAVPPPGPILLGGLQLDVEPRRALVYVDGVLAGTVDQFKGYFQHLETSAGYHVISFVTPDYEPLTIGITVVPGKTTTYRGFLNRAYD